MEKTRDRRAARHNGRVGKNGAYSAKHSDRNFDVATTTHIDPNLAHLNIHQRYAGKFEEAKTNEEYELAFYEKHFGDSLARKNAAYKTKGKSGQIKTMEEYHRAVKSCPEETYYTAGEGVDRELLWQIYTKHQAWKAEQFPLCQTLTADLHADEPNAMYHIHERSVWIGHDSKGLEVVGQAKALAEMGVLPPDPSKKTGKYNNAKQTFTRECRENFVQLCKEHGLEIVTEAKPSGEVGLELLEYQIQHAQEREQEARAQLQGLQDRASVVQDQLETATREASEAQAKAESLGSQIDESEIALRGLCKALVAAQNQLDKVQKDVVAMIDAMASRADLEDVQPKLRIFGRVSLSQKDYDKLYRTAEAAAVAQQMADNASATAQKLSDVLARQDRHKRALVEETQRTKARLREQEEELGLLRTLLRLVTELFRNEPDLYDRYRNHCRNSEDACFGRMDWRLQEQLDLALGTSYAAEDKARYLAQRVERKTRQGHER